MRISDWSSDVCSSDLGSSGGHHGGSSGSSGGPPAPVPAPPMLLLFGAAASALVVRKRPARQDRKRRLSGQSVSVRVDLGGRRTTQNHNANDNTSHVHTPLDHEHILRAQTTNNK